LNNSVGRNDCANLLVGGYDPASPNPSHMALGIIRQESATSFRWTATVALFQPPSVNNNQPVNYWGSNSGACITNDTSGGLKRLTVFASGDNNSKSIFATIQNGNSWWPWQHVDGTAQPLNTHSFPDGATLPKLHAACFFRSEAPGSLADYSSVAAAAAPPFAPPTWSGWQGLPPNNVGTSVERGMIRGAFRYSA
jgi:hypothetical protein